MYMPIKVIIIYIFVGNLGTKYLSNKYQKHRLISGIHSIDGAHIISLSSSPKSTNPVEEHSVINFACTLDVNPPPYLTLWTRGKVEEIHEQRETSSLMVSLNITRKYNRVGIFCEAVTGDVENATTSNELNFDVICKYFYIN